jgi:hypothetical protein
LVYLFKNTALRTYLLPSNAVLFPFLFTSLQGMCLLLPCAAGATWGGWKIQKSLDKAFASSTSEPAEPTESVVVTEAKLAFKVCMDF